MIKLVHTGMRIPTDRIRVTNLYHVDLGSGNAWSAVVRDGSTRLGVIANDGRGAATQFHAFTEETQRVMDDFVAWCRSHDGEPLPEEFVVDTLVDEYGYARDVAEAERKGRYLVRTFDAYDVPELHTFALKHGGPLDYETALQVAPRLPLSERTVRAELWMGAERGWVEFSWRTSDQ